MVFSVSALFRFLVLVCAGMTLSACLPGLDKNLFRALTSPSNPSYSESGNSSLYSGEDILDAELREASTHPDVLVAHSQGISEHTEEEFGSLSELELSSLPAGLMLLEMSGDADGLMPEVPSKPVQLAEEESTPAVAALAPAVQKKSTVSPAAKASTKKKTTKTAYNSKEDRALARKNTRASLCRRYTDSLCITSPYGVKRAANRWHKGIDIRAPMGSPIKAFRSGEVIRAQYHRTFGYLVEIRQDDGLLARYAHMSQILARKGDRVYPGLMIGRVGSTGRSTGPHLHFELLNDTRHVNPMVLLSTPRQIVVQGTAEDAAAARAALAKSGKGKKKVKKSKKSTKKVASKTSSKKPSQKATASKSTTAKNGASPKTAISASKKATPAASVQKAAPARKEGSKSAVSAAKPAAKSTASTVQKSGTTQNNS